MPQAEPQSGFGLNALLGLYVLKPRKAVVTCNTDQILKTSVVGAPRQGIESQMVGVTPVITKLVAPWAV